MKKRALDLDDLREARLAGIKFIKNEHIKHSYFGYKTIFPTILVLDCLSSINEPSASKLKEVLVKQLLEHKSQHWTFNYWRRDVAKYDEEPYPDDLDDTFCALSAIFKVAPELVKGDTWAQVVATLTHTEITPGGPYNTWLVDSDQDNSVWQDIDIAVNSNVAHFLLLHDIQLEPLQRYLISQCKIHKLRSPYYAGEIPILYFLSRTDLNEATQIIQKNILNYLTHSLSSLELSLCLTSLIRLGFQDSLIDERMTELLNQQLPSGHWEADDFYYYRDIQVKSDYIRSEVLSSAFALEALNLYQNYVWKTKPKSRNQPLETLRSNIYQITQEQLQQLPNVFEKKVNTIFEQIIEIDHRSQFLISLTTANVWHSMRPVLRQEISRDQLLEISMIGMYGWLSYTVMDDVIDRDKDVAWLMVSNLFQRLLHQQLEKSSQIMPHSSKYRGCYTRILNTMEAANYIELTQYRFQQDKLPKKIQPLEYSTLSHKSLGHVIGPLSLLMFLGYTDKSPEFKSIYAYFSNFLIARQMNDDAHDWEEDLNRGFINSAAERILRHYNKTSIDLDELRRIFWFKVAPQYGRSIKLRLHKALQNPDAINLFQSDDWFQQQLRPLMKSTQAFIDQQKLGQDFIKQYGKSLS